MTGLLMQDAVEPIRRHKHAGGGCTGTLALPYTHGTLAPHILAFAPSDLYLKLPQIRTLAPQS